jgi:Methylase involved in ubiquinone/menaquinone biosynthesis
MAANWTGKADAYASSFALLCAGAVEAILDAVEEPEAHTTLLDAGTGSGTVAARAAGRGFAVSAFDAEADMVAYAAERLGGVDTRVAVLPDLPYPDGEFDAVTANFVVNHLSDPRAGLRELRRVCAGGGRCALTIWPGSPAGMNGFWSGALDEAGLPPAAGMRLPVELDFERSESGLAGIMTEAGFTAVAATRISWTFEIDPDELWRGVTSGIGTIGATYRGAHPDGREAIRAAYRRRVGAHTRGGVLRIPVEAVLGTGSSPR